MKFFWLGLAVLFVSPTIIPGAEKINFDRWQKINQKLFSPTVRERIWAVKQLSILKSKEAETLMRERFLSETSSEVLLEILRWFQKRSARSDFFYILDFIKKAPSGETLQKAFSVLRDIHLRRTHYEVIELIQHEKYKPHFLYYILSYDKIPDTELVWIRKTLRDYGLLGTYIRYPRKKDPIVLKALKKIAFKDLFPRNTAEVYYALKLNSDIDKFRELPKWYIGPALVLDVPEFRRKEFLDMIYRAFPDNFHSKKSDFKVVLSQSFAAKVWLFRWAHSTQANDSLYDQYKELLREEKSLKFWYIVTAYKGPLTEDESKAVEAACEDNKIPKNFCLRRYLKEKPEKFEDEWKALPPSEKTKFVLSNFSLFISSAPYSKKDIYFRLLRSGDKRVRLMTWLSLTPEVYRLRPLMFQSRYFTETDSTNRDIAIAKIMQAENSPSDKLLRYIIELYTPESSLVPSVSKKKSQMNNIEKEQSVNEHEKTPKNQSESNSR